MIVSRSVKEITLSMPPGVSGNRNKRARVASGADENRPHAVYHHPSQHRLSHQPALYADEQGFVDPDYVAQFFNQM